MTEIIKKKRKQMGMTQKELAERCGVSYQTISNLERGVAYSKDLLEKVCSILDLGLAIVDNNPIEDEKKVKKTNNRVTFID
jgi:transcriptional regulator with XRE-family HTH domain